MTLLGYACFAWFYLQRGVYVHDFQIVENSQLGPWFRHYGDCYLRDRQPPFGSAGADDESERDCFRQPALGSSCADDESISDCLSTYS